jgi:hypothetical protein
MPVQGRGCVKTPISRYFFENMSSDSQTNSLRTSRFHTASVESSHLRALSLRGERGNHTIYFCELLRVTVRVNLGALRGYVRP